jgi:hypothetical protein
MPRRMKAGPHDRVQQSRTEPNPSGQSHERQDAKEDEGCWPDPPPGVDEMPDCGGDDAERWLAEGIAGVQQNAFYMHCALVSPLPPDAEP